MFFGENRGNVFKVARMAVDAGADIIFGQGPHVTRGIELYKNRFISYSAGNFATYGKFNLKGKSGIAPIFKITLILKEISSKGKLYRLNRLKEHLVLLLMKIELPLRKLFPSIKVISRKEMVFL